MKEPFLFRFLRDSAYVLGSLWIIFYLIDFHMNVWQGQELFEWFVIASELILALVFLCNLDDGNGEKRQYKFLVEVDGDKYDADLYSINLMQKASHVILNQNEYIAISDIDTLKITQNSKYKVSVNGTMVDISDILKHAQEFAEECKECEKGMTDPYQGPTAREATSGITRKAPNKGKKMSEAQKKKISESLKKYNAKKPLAKQAPKTTRNLKK